MISHQNWLHLWACCWAFRTHFQPIRSWRKCDVDYAKLWCCFMLVGHPGGGKWIGLEQMSYCRTRLQPSNESVNMRVYDKVYTTGRASHVRGVQRPEAHLAFPASVNGSIIWIANSAAFDRRHCSDDRARCAAPDKNTRHTARTVGAASSPAYLDAPLCDISLFLPLV